MNEVYGFEQYINLYLNKIIHLDIRGIN
jgi:hypothetical protein